MHQQIYMDLPHVAMCKASRPGKKGLPPNMLIVSRGYQSLGQFSVVNTMVSLVFEETEGEIQNRKLKKCQSVCCNCRAKDLPLSLSLSPAVSALKTFNVMLKHVETLVECVCQRVMVILVHSY